ncbi:MAG: SMI1/KNR4 family protein [Bacteroidota bacterium]
MSENIFFSDVSLNFNAIGEGIDKEYLDSIISADFEGKEYFAKFYAFHNGVIFPEGAEFTGKQSQKIGFEVELIYEADRIKKRWEGIKKHSEEAVKMAKTHFPFSSDAAGNQYLIEFQTGVVKFVSWEDFSEKESMDTLQVVTSSFKDFCLGLRKWTY